MPVKNRTPHGPLLTPLFLAKQIINTYHRRRQALISDMTGPAGGPGTLIFVHHLGALYLGTWHPVRCKVYRSHITHKRSTTDRSATDIMLPGLPWWRSMARSGMKHRRSGAHTRPLTGVVVPHESAPSMYKVPSYVMRSLTGEPVLESIYGHRERSQFSEKVATAHL